MNQRKSSDLIAFPTRRRTRRRVGGELADLRAEALREKFRKADNFSMRPSKAPLKKLGLKHTSR